MKNTYIIYQKQGRICKYRTAKSYIKFKARIYARAKFDRFSAFVERKTAKPLNIVTNA